MKNIVGLFVLALLLLSCGNGKSGESEVICGGPGIGIDTATVKEIQRYEDSLRATESVNESSPSRQAVSPSSSSSSKHKYNEPDNMRGFDPASEDDMDDNGMSRYMENDDDEGWD